MTGQYLGTPHNNFNFIQPPLFSPLIVIFIPALVCSIVDIYFTTWLEISHSRLSFLQLVLYKNPISILFLSKSHLTPSSQCPPLSISYLTSSPRIFSLVLPHSSPASVPAYRPLNESTFRDTGRISMANQICSASYCLSCFIAWIFSMMRGCF